MKEGWSYKKLGEVCETLNGLWKGKKPPFVNVGVIRNANFTKDFTLRFDNIEYLDVEERQYSKRKLQKGDLIVEKSGGSEKQPVGRAVLFDKENGEFSFSNFTSVLRIRDKNTFLCEFLYKYLLFIYKRGDTSAMQKATTGIHNIEFEKYLNIDIPCIPLSEQHSIVSRLDSAFSHIDALKANAEKQLNEARKLFQAELTECMKPKEGWEEKTLKEVSEIAGEYGLNASSKPFDGVRYLRITDITDFGYLNDDKVSANVEDGKKQDELVEGDILFARTGATVGKTLVYRKDFGDCLFAGYLIRYRLKKDCILPRFIHYITHSKEYYKWVETNQEAAAQPNISAKKYNMLFIRYPNIDVQHRIVSHLDSLSSTIRKLEELQQKTLAECDALKQAMLREVFE